MTSPSTSVRPFKATIDSGYVWRERLVGLGEVEFEGEGVGLGVQHMLMVGTFLFPAVQSIKVTTGSRNLDGGDLEYH